MKQPYKNLTELFTPENYQIELEIAPDRRHFIGHEIIVGRKKTEEYIRLHWHNEHQGLAVKVNDVEVHHLQFCDHDEVILNENADEKIAKYHAGQNLTIDLCFSGEIIDGSMSGLYPAKYGERELLTTQFESTGARRVFPCVDEPAAKATFDLSITAQKDFAKTIVSNQPALSRKNHDDQITVKFATTPKMSTYLLAFVVGDLQKISRKTTRGVTINVYATPVQNPASLTFAANFAAKAIDFYEQYFGVEYPLSKSDQVAIPDFSAGAMEN
jgi:aminopeptidase N